MLVEKSDKQWKIWDDMDRNEVRKKVRPSVWAHTDTSSEGVKLPLVW